MIWYDQCVTYIRFYSAPGETGSCVHFPYFRRVIDTLDYRLPAAVCEPAKLKSENQAADPKHHGQARQPLAPRVNPDLHKE
jgi:hypothetical protein